MLPAELTHLSLEQASRGIRRRQVSALELTNACLDRMRAYQPLLNAFIVVTEEEALQHARALDQELRAGRWRGPLHGIPIALKDNIDLARWRTTAASNVRRNSAAATTDAEVVRRLKHAGAIFLGKTNLVEFATFGPSTASAFGAVRNPWSLDRTTGGSSSGSAAAVAARMCFGAIGTDSGGSIRSPAAICGISGLKPTYGRVSNRGVIPFTWSTDTVGPLARSATDAAIMLQAMAGYDAADPASVDVPVPDYAREIRRTVRELRIGVAISPYFEEVRPEYERAINEALKEIATIAPNTRDVALPLVDPDLFAIIQRVEAYAYHKADLQRAPNLYGPLLRSRLEMAKRVSAADYAEARHELDRLRRAAATVFEQVDVVITPSRTSSEKIAEIRPDDTSVAPLTTRVRNPFYPMNAFGIPAISIPCGFTPAGLPVGLQLAGPMWSEGRLLALARAYQERTSWHVRLPSFASTID